MVPKHSLRGWFLDQTKCKNRHCNILSLRVCPFKKITDSKERNSFTSKWQWCQTVSLLFRSHKPVSFYEAESAQNYLFFFRLAYMLKASSSSWRGKTATYSSELSSNEPWDLQLGQYSLTLYCKEERWPAELSEPLDGEQCGEK